MAIITEKGVERIFVPGDELPGKRQVLPSTFSHFTQLLFFRLNANATPTCLLFFFSIVHWEG